MSVERLSYIDQVPILISKEEAYSVEGNRILTFKPNGFSESTLIRSVYKDKNGRTWFTDNKNHLWLKTASTFQNLTLTYTTKEVLDPNYMEDENGNMVITSVYGVTVFKESFCKEIVISEINNSDYSYVINLLHKDTLVCGINKHGLICIVKGQKMVKPILFDGLELDEKGFQEQLQLQKEQ